MIQYNSVYRQSLRKAGGSLAGCEFRGPERPREWFLDLSVLFPLSCVSLPAQERNKKQPCLIHINNPPLIPTRSRPRAFVVTHPHPPPSPSGTTSLAGFLRADGARALPRGIHHPPAPVRGPGSLRRGHRHRPISFQQPAALANPGGGGRVGPPRRSCGGGGGGNKSGGS